MWSDDGGPQLLNLGDLRLRKWDAWTSGWGAHHKLRRIGTIAYRNPDESERNPFAPTR